jgi:outer membrane biosynthesis protein TonB
MRKLPLAFLLLGSLSLASACASTVKAKTPVERPNLDVPPPPPRVVEPAPVPEAPPEPVPDLPPPPAPIKPKPTPPRTQPTEPKPESKPEQPPPDNVQSSPPTPMVPQLQTPQTADGTEAEKNVRSTLERAKSVLGTVNYSPLSKERKKAYNDAKAFIHQAEDAIKQGNYVFAQSLATKAETLATELGGR